MRRASFGQVTLMNGAEIPIGRGKYEALKEAMEMTAVSFHTARDYS